MTPTDSALPTFLNHPGTCAQVLRTADAARFAELGAPAGWPAELRVLTNLLLASSEAMFIAWGPQRLFFYNDAYAPILGARHPAALGLPMQTVWHAHWPDLSPLVDRTFAGHSVQLADVALWIERSGTSQEARFSCGYHPVRDDHGEVRGLFCVCRDTTAQHAAQQQASRSNLLYQTLLDSMGEGVVMLDRDFRVQRINREGLRMDGRREDEIVGRLHNEVWPAAVGTAVDRAYRDAMASNEPRCLQHRYVAGDIDIWLDIGAYPVQGGLALVYRDITALKKIDAARIASELRFAAALGAVGMMWTNNADGEMEGDQPGWAAITGQTRAAYEGYGWAAAVHPDDAEPTVAAWKLAVAQQRKFEFEHRLRTATGEWRRYAVRAMPVIDAAGAVTEWVGVHIDVTEARQAVLSLVEADRRKDEFLAILAHELRNPLAPIRNAASVLNNAAVTPGEMAASRNIINRQIRHMALLLDDLLDTSRISAGRLQLRKQFHLLHEVVHAAVETARPLLDSKAHRLDVQLPDGAVQVEVDELRMAQVLSNLLMNAAKYTDDSGRVGLRARVGTAALLIEVTDNGIGISAAQQPYVFDMFSQLRSATDRAQGGLGIGLALARGLVELHGGSLGVASDGLGCGATFTVYLPTRVIDPGLARPAITPVERSAVALSAASATASVVSSIASPAAPASTTLVRPSPASPPAPTPAPRADADALHILIADDNADAAESLAMLLRLEAFQLHITPDGAAAVDVARRVRPQVAILDIGMPGLDGYVVAQRLRAEAWGRGMLLIALTGWGQHADQQRALAAGFDKHYTKPVDPDVLIDLIKTWHHEKSVAP